MWRFRRSRFSKFIAGILILFLSVAIVANIAGTLLIMDENLYYAGRDLLQQKVYSYLYDYTASDLMRYLSIAEDMQSNNEAYRNYNSSELELYRSKYSANNSNIVFRITDEQGNILLKNEHIITDRCISFSSTFATNTVYSSEWFQQSDSEKVTAVTAYNGAPTTLNNEVQQPETSEPAEDESMTAKEETVTETKDDISDIIPLPPADTTKYQCEESNVTNINSDNITKIYYYHKAPLDFKIYQYCKDIAKGLSHNISEISFWQEDYTVGENEDYEYGYFISQSFNVTDDTVPTKSFSTKLYCNGKTADITYTYNGSFYPEEFESRLSLSSLILENSSDTSKELSYYQKSRVQLKVEVLVPYNSSVKDIYRYAEQLIDIGIIYMDNIIAITVLDFLLFILSFVFIFWSAGYIPGRDEPVARGLHRIPFDLYLLLTAAGAVGCLAIISTSDELFVVLGFIGWALLLIGLLYTMTVRLRTATLKKNTVTYKLFTAVKSAAAVMNEATGSKLVIALATVLFVFITVCEIILLFTFNPDYHEVSAILFILRALELPVVLLLLITLTAVHSGAKAISKGDIEYRIRNPLLFGPIKKHAEYLNSINDAVNSAVEERMKSESLKTELITNVSHDLKTPLTSIVNYVDLLKKEEIDNPKANEYIEVIDRQSQRLKKLAVDIVEASKAATGNIEVHIEDTALNVILQQTSGEYIERLEEKKLLLVAEIPDEAITVSTDGRLLWRIIDNLMSNICKYSMPGTRVYLSLERTDHSAVISFRNISREKLNITPESLTERFVRGDTSRNTEGSGLGLSIANSLAKIIGSELDITIDGDLFKVTLRIPIEPHKPS